MNKDEIMATLRSLAQSQGFYGRVLEAICSAGEEYKNAYLDMLESKHFKDPLDLVLFFET